MTKQSNNPLALMLSLIAVSVCGVAGQQRAEAQETSLQLEEILVTARKRTESLLDIPESVVAITETEINRQNIKGLNMVGLAIPNLNLSMRADGFPNVSIRGVGAFGMTQGIGFYLDDIQLFGDASSRFGDVSRIEVLKGPQGVLYGGSNIGGAVKYVSVRPSTESVSGRVKLLSGEQSIRDGEAAINIPLSDSWAVRMFGFSRSDDGFMRNPNSPSPVFGVLSNQDPDVGAYEERGGRLALAGQVTDRFSVYASARYNEYDGPVNNWARELGTSPKFDYPFTLDTNLNPSHKRETTGAHLELSLDLERVNIKSITSYTDTDSRRETDVDLTQLWFFNTLQPQNIEVKTHEFRLTSLNEGSFQWVAGVYLTDFQEEMNSTLDFGWIVLGADDPSVTAVVPFETRREDKSNSAAFANMTYEFGSWEIGLGLRADRWTSKEVALDVGHKASRTETEILPKFSVRKDLGEGMLYGTITKGFEPGGWNGIADGSPLIFGPNGEKTLIGFDPETTVQYELGWKGSLMDGRATSTVAVFWSNYKDRQFEFIVPNPSGTGLIDGITNVGDSDQWGLEVSGTVKLTEHLDVTSGFGFIDAEWVKNTILEDGLDLSGQEPSNILDRSLSVSAKYKRPLTNGFDLIGDLQMSYKGEMLGGKPWDNVTNPDFTVVSLQLGMANERWEFTLNVENLLDEKYYTDLEPFDNFGFDGLTGTGPARIIIGTHGHPRVVTGSISYFF